MKETDSSSPTPEQLLQMLDAGIQMQRARRSGAARNRGVVLTLGFVFILMGAVVALRVLSQMLDGSHRAVGEPTVAVQE